MNLLFGKDRLLPQRFFLYTETKMEIQTRPLLPYLHLYIQPNDNFVIPNADSVTITATFNEDMADAPKIHINGLVSNAAMTPSGNSKTVWRYTWNVGICQPLVKQLSQSLERICQEMHMCQVIN